MALARSLKGIWRRAPRGGAGGPAPDGGGRPRTLPPGIAYLAERPRGERWWVWALWLFAWATVVALWAAVVYVVVFVFLPVFWRIALDIGGS